MWNFTDESGMRGHTQYRAGAQLPHKEMEWRGVLDGVKIMYFKMYVVDLR